MIKRLGAFALLICVLALSGCSFELKPIETLMRPPLTATERELEKSIDSIIGSNISLRSPTSGSYHSAITLHDLDGDRNDEAVIFYVNNNDTAVIRMCVLKKNSGGWQLVSDFAGSGSGVYSVDFHDLNNDGSDDMLVSWYLFDNKSNKILTIYSGMRTDGEISFSACETQPYNHICVADIQRTGGKQLVLTYTDSAKSEERTSIRLLALNEQNRVVLVSETVLDDRIISITAITAEAAESADGVRVFVDAVIRDNKLITEILAWSREDACFKTLIPASEQYDSLVTARTTNLYCYDIDSDGIIEIPRREALGKNKNSDTSYGYMLVWYDYSNGRFTRESGYLVNVSYNYRILVPDELSGKISVRSENGNSLWRFVGETGEDLFSVEVYSVQDWGNNADTSARILLTADERVYVCRTEPVLDSYGITADDLERSFSLNS